MTVARGKAVDSVRAERSRRRREKRCDDRAVQAGGDDVEVGLLERERIVADAVDGLPLVERDALVIAFYGQCSYRQAAAILGQPEGTIKSRIHAGLHRLGLALVDVPIERGVSASAR